MMGHFLPYVWFHNTNKGSPHYTSAKESDMAGIYAPGQDGNASDFERYATVYGVTRHMVLPAINPLIPFIFR